MSKVKQTLLRLSLAAIAAFTVVQAPVYVHANDTQVTVQTSAPAQSSREDQAAPDTFITVPIMDYTADTTTTYQGYATDATGGSGFDRVDIAIRDSTTELWYDFTKNTFGPISDADGNLVGITASTLSNTTSNYTEWSISITLPAGRYQFFALAIDNAGNSQYSGTGVWPVNTSFNVK